MIKLQHLVMLGVIGMFGLALSCQTNAPLEPLVGHDRVVQGAIADLGPIPPAPPPPKYKNFGECVGACQDARHKFFQKCTRNGDPHKCAEKAKVIWDNCVDQCVKNCEAECEVFRQETFEWLLSTGKYSPDEAASLANSQAEKCKDKCKDPMKSVQ